jgi:hypothetical protein
MKEKPRMVFSSSRLRALAVATVAAGVVAGGVGAVVASAHGGHNSRSTANEPQRVCRELASGDITTGLLSTLTSAQVAQLKTDCGTLTAAEGPRRTADQAAANALRTALGDARDAFKTACPQTGATGSTGATGVSGPHGWTPLSPECLAALKIEHQAERAAEKTYEQALRTAAAPVNSAARTVAADLTADEQANGATGATGPTGSFGSHGHRHRWHPARWGGTGATGPTGPGFPGHRWHPAPWGGTGATGPTGPTGPGFPHHRGHQNGGSWR